MTHWLPRGSCASLVCALAILVSGESARSETKATELAEAISPTATVRGTEVRESDWAKLQARARVAYISSGPRPLTGRMIDNDLTTTFRFSESDKSPTVIVELAQSVELHRIRTVFKGDNARLDVFLLNELPKNENNLQLAKPFASTVNLPENQGTVTVDFSPGSARYVALRWTGNKSREPFQIAEISAFSNEPADWIASDPHLAANSGPNFFASGPPPIPVISQ